MTQMAETAIDTLYNSNLTLKSGYLQNFEVPGPGVGSPVANVNKVSTGISLQFFPYGSFSDGSLHYLNNTNGGNAVYGTWSSSNPLVMSINQQGLSFTTTPGTAIIHFTPFSGCTSPNGS